ncbi:hypothetical protein Tco_0062816, partial [Tanacetum coccineum]
MSHFHVVKGNWGSAVKTSAGYNWRNSNPNSNCDSGPMERISKKRTKNEAKMTKPDSEWKSRKKTKS